MFSNIQMTTRTFWLLWPISRFVKSKCFLCLENDVFNRNILGYAKKNNILLVSNITCFKVTSQDYVAWISFKSGVWKKGD